MVWEDYLLAGERWFLSAEQPDLRPHAEKQEPHLLVIESIDYQNAHGSELWVECPLDHHAARHWCSEEVYVTSLCTFELVGAVVHVNFRTLVGCWITSDVENAGVLEMLGVPWSGCESDVPWPDELPQQPGTYPVVWDCDGHGEEAMSWLELL